MPPPLLLCARLTLARLPARRGAQVHGLLAESGAALDPAEPLARAASGAAGAGSGMLIAQCGHSATERRAVAALAASGLLGCLPRAPVVPFPATVRDTAPAAATRALGAIHAFAACPAAPGLVPPPSHPPPPGAAARVWPLPQRPRGARSAAARRRDVRRALAPLLSPPY
jgi:hypothetical protein